MSESSNVQQAFVVEQQPLLERRAQLALDYAKSLGATACEVGANVTQGLQVEVRLGEIETLTMARDQGIGITVYHGHQEGSASSSDDSEAAIRETVERAIAIARYSGEDPAAGLADPRLLATDFPDLDLYHPWALTADEATEKALECEQAGREIAGIVNSEGASLSSGEAVSLYANSNGFLQCLKGTSHSMACALIARDSNGMQREFDLTIARAPGDLILPSHIGVSAAQKTLARLSPRPIKTGRYPVIFSPDMARSLIQHLLQALSGGAQYREASFLHDALGERLMPEWFSLGEKPHEKRGLASANFDDEGVATRENLFIDHGSVANYLLSSYSARRLKMESTGNSDGAHNIRINAPLTSYKDMLSHMGTGVLVTELMGQGVNSVTGDYSRGAAGFWIENGEVQFPVEGFTIAGNLREMYRGLQAIGDDIDVRGNAFTGSWVIDGMMVAGE